MHLPLHIRCFSPFLPQRPAAHAPEQKLLYEAPSPNCPAGQSLQPFEPVWLNLPAGHAMHGFTDFFDAYVPLGHGMQRACCARPCSHRPCGQLPHTREPGFCAKRPLGHASQWSRRE